MAEHDPIPPKDADESAYREALLGEDAGREQRRARLMAALPRPVTAAATPVARVELAWRWQPYALGVLATGLLLAAVWVLKGGPTEPGQTVDPRVVAAAPAASVPVVVAQAEPSPVPSVDAQIAAAPPVAAKAAVPKPRAVQPPAVVVADASLPQQRREVEAAVAVATESARLAVEPPPPAPAMAPAPVSPAPAAPAVAAPPAPSPPAAPVAAAPVSPPSKFNQPDALARAEVTTDLTSARSRMSLAASDAAPVKLMTPAESILLAAVNHADLATARSALQAGASVHLRDAQGRTVLMLAARTGSREMVDLLLAAGARKADRDPQGWTVADHARDQGHDELAERLR